MGFNKTKQMRFTQEKSNWKPESFNLVLFLEKLVYQFVI